MKVKLSQDIFNRLLEFFTRQLQLEKDSAGLGEEVTRILDTFSHENHLPCAHYVVTNSGYLESREGVLISEYNPRVVHTDTLCNQLNPFTP